MAKAVDNPPDKIINIQPSHRPLIYSVAAVLVLLIVFALGVSVAGSRHNPFFGMKGVAATPGFAGRFRAGGFNRYMQNGQNRLAGVVTSVNGSNFTVAGNGSTTNVTTNSSTQYKNGNQLKPNDTVIVFGTENNGTVTASRVNINP